MTNVIKFFKAGNFLTFVFFLISTEVLAQPNAPSGLNAVTSSTIAINLTWTDNSSNETNFLIERSTGDNTSFTQIAMTAANTTSYSSGSLSPGVKYYYRVRSTNGGGQSAYTAEANGTTYLSTPTSLSASIVSTTELNLTWTDNSSNETGFQIDRSTTSGSGFSTVTTTAANATSYLDAGRSPGVRYYYKIKAVNADGSSVYTSEINKTPYLIAPTGVVATATSATSIVISWTDNSSNETGFPIERSTSSTSGFSQIGSGGANQTSYTDNTVTAGVTYYYQMRAANGPGASQYTSVVTPTNLIAPSSLSVVAVSTTGIDLTWVDNSPNETGFQIERSLTTATGFSVVTTTGANATSFSDTGLSAGYRYFYRIKSVNASTSSTYTAEANATARLSEPTNFAISSVTTNTINLSWTDNSSNETGFPIERSTDNVNFTTLNPGGAANAVSYSNSSLTPGTVYYYRIRATNGTGTSVTSSVISATTLLPPPTNLAAAASSTSQIDLSWTDASSNETGFQIERSLTTNTGFSVVTTTGPNVTSYSNTGLATTTKYYYKIKAVNAVSASVYTAEASTTTFFVAPTNLKAIATSANDVSLSWIDNSANESGFEVWRSTTSGSGFTKLSTPASANAQTYSNSGLTAGTTYFYKIRAYNGTPTYSDFTAEYKVITATPSAPSALTATTIGPHTIRLNWTDNSFGESGFTVERSLTTGSGFVAIGTAAPDAVTFDDSSLTGSTTYYYRIRATNAIGNSSYTSEASSTTEGGQVADIDEFNALKDLYNSTGGANWTNKTNWPTSWPASATIAQMDTWYGIDVANGDITGIVIESNNLNGTIPSSIGNLVSLDHLYLDGNTLISGNIPSNIGNLTNLRFLALANTHLTGSIPSSVGDMTNLLNLDFSGNQLNGHLPSSLGNITSLQLLSLAGNQFDGGIPEQLGNLVNLNSLDISGNVLGGPIPAKFGDLVNLHSLRMAGCGLTGPIPSTFQNLTQLTELFLNSNSLSGTIPFHLNSCVNLQLLYLDHNNFTAIGYLGNLTSAIYITLNNNNLSGNVPDWIGNLAGMYGLYLQDNKFSGSLPTSITNMTNLGVINLSNNHFSGALPDISGMTGLAYFNASGNKFSGQVPSSYSTSLPIHTFNVANNELTGVFPNINAWSNLISLELQGNKFNDGFPNVSQSVHFIGGRSNHFTSMPVSLLNLGTYAYVDLELNEINKISGLDGAYSGNTIHMGDHSQIYLTWNNLDFPTMEKLKNISTSQNPNGEIHYGYQNDTGYSKPIIISSTTSLLEIPSRDMGSNTSIIWQKLLGNGTWDTKNVTTSTYTKTSAGLDDEGEYRWQMSDTGFPSVTLKSGRITVKTEKRVKMDNWAFQYKYDSRKRMTHKKVPGADWVYMVYDQRDRLIMTQDGEQRKNNQWSYSQYDELNRPVITGIYTHPSLVEQEEMSSFMSTQLFNETFGLSYANGYSFTVFDPVHFTGSFFVLTVTYYDNYDFKNLFKGRSYHYDKNQLSHSLPPGYMKIARGLVTGTKVRILKNNSWLKTVSYYDDKYRTIQVITDNIKGGVDKTSNVYDFAGRLLQTKTISFHEDLQWQWRDRWYVSVVSNSVEGLNNSAIWSGKTLPEGTDGYIEFTVEDTNGTKGIGFSEANDNPFEGYMSMPHSFSMSSYSGQIRAAGNQISSFSFQAGDRFKIKREGSELKYFQNDTQLISYDLESQNEFRVAVGFNGVATINDITTDFSVRDSISEKRWFVYDHASRVKETWHTIGTDSVLLVKQEYNELGQLVDKKLHSATGDNHFKQSIDYRYNIRGWLSSINNEALTQDVSNNDFGDASDLFGIKLIYNEESNTTNLPQFNGNISAVKWSAGLATGAIKSYAYNYRYDAMNRIDSARFKKWNGLKWVYATDAFGEHDYKYDLNGNIRSLVRRDASGVVVDNLTYDYGTSVEKSNRLLSVSDATNIEKGFIDGNTGSNDYVYDYNGSMIADRNKRIGSINYNHLNLPSEVLKTDGNRIMYYYDATGRKLTQFVAGGSYNMKKKTDYAGTQYYEGDSLKFINHEEGRVLMTGATKEYQYHLKDHLGNVRTTFTTKEDVETTTATFDCTVCEEEQSQYLRYKEARRVYSGLVDHTNGSSPGYAQRLNGSIDERFGLARSLSVMPGDIVRLEVYAKYFDKSSPNWAGSLFATLASQVTSHVANVVIDGINYYNSNASFPAGFPALAQHDNNAPPKAYLNWLIFDRDFKFIKGKSKQISAAAAEDGTGRDHELIVPDEGDIVITDPGYVYVYLSNENESEVEVYFDDFKVIQVKSPVIQTSDYYAFGMPFNSYSRENSFLNKTKLFQGQEHISDLGLEWDSFKWRNHQPDLGRFFNIDPLSEKYYSNSVYAFSENHVTTHIELEGKEKLPINHDGFENDLDRVARSKTEITRTGSEIQVSSVDGKGTVVNSSTIQLPSTESQSKVSDLSAKTIGEVAMTAKESNIRVSSLKRDAMSQGKAMYDNLVGKGKGQGVVAQRDLYRTAPGSQVINTYTKSRALQALAKQFGGSFSERQIQSSMVRKVDELGVHNVTNHASLNPKLNVIDVAPTSVAESNHAAFSKAGETHPAVTKFIPYPRDPGFHFEILNP